MGGVSHYSGMIALGAGAVAIGSPLAIGIGAALMGGVYAYAYKANQKILNNGLVTHPDQHRFSPNLKKIINNLFEKSGLSHHKAVVHDFKVTAATRLTPLGRNFDSMLKKVAVTPNAAAANLGKPVIMISEPLLELLDDHEEEAVLAHEFAHVVAQHQHIRIPKLLLSGVIKVSNNIAVLNQLIHTGVIGVPAAIGASVIGKGVFKALHPKGHLLGDKGEKDLPAYIKDYEENKGLRELSDTKRVKKQAEIFTKVVFTGVATMFNPTYLPVMAAATGMNMAAKYIESSFSRNNEFQADRGAVVIGSSPLSLITALRKITGVYKKSVAQAWGEEPEKPSFLSTQWKNAFASHPPVEKRIARLAKMAAKQGYSAEDIDRAVNASVILPDTVNIPASHIRGMAKAFVGVDNVISISNHLDAVSKPSSLGGLAGDVANTLLKRSGFSKLIA